MERLRESPVKAPAPWVVAPPKAVFRIVPVVCLVSMSTFEVPVLMERVSAPESSPKVVVPVVVRVVKAPEPAVVAPTETKFAAPAAVIFQLSSVIETVVAEVEPMAMVLATAPVAMLTVLAVVAPVPMLMVSAPVPVPKLMVLVTESVVPKLRVVAAPPKDSVVTVVLNKVPVVVVEVISAEVAPLTARSPLMVVSSERVIEDDPLSIVIFPVSDPPRVSVLLSVVDMVPPELTYVPPPVDEAATEATGVPELMFKTANLADDVACPPTRRSRVELTG